MDLIMGIDIGSTNTKAVVFDLHGRVRAAGSTETRLSFDAAHPGWTFWAPDDIWNGVKAAVAGAVGRLAPNDRVVSVACSSFSADFVPLDTGLAPLYPFKSWHCARAVPQMRAWLETHDENELLYRHGVMTEMLLSLFMMRWLRENRPEIAKETRMILQVSDYVNFRLTGRTVTDYSQAASSGAFDPVRAEWNAEYLAWAGFTPEQLPQALPAGTAIGRILPQVAAETGLSPDTLVSLGAHDNECACLSLGMRDFATAYNICGTWDMIMVMHRKPDFDAAHAAREIAVLRNLLPDSWISRKFGLGANFLEWGKENLYGGELERARAGGRSVWDCILEQTAKVPPLSNGILALPFRAGASGRERRQFASGTIMGIDNYLGKADVLHALFEALGYQTRDYLENIEAALGRRYERLACVGGPTRNAQLMQIKADICNRPVEVSEVAEGTALGAAMLGGIGCGLYADGIGAIDAVTGERSRKIYAPQPQNTQRYQEGYQKYLQATALLSQIDNIEPVAT